MNIDWYSHYFSPEVGAPSARLNDLSRCFIEHGHRVHVNTCFPNHPHGVLYPGYHHGLYLRENISGIKVSRYWSYITENRGFVKKLTGHVSFLLSTVIQSQRKPVRPDVVIGTSPTFFAALAAAGHSLRYRVPFVMEVRDLWPAIFVELGVLKNPILIGLLEKIELWMYRHAVRVVTVTESFRQNLISRGVSPNKVVNIPNGADLDYWQPQEGAATMRKALGLEGKFIVLYIGAHGISHALIRILECAGKLKEEKGIHFLFVGDGAEKETLQAYAQKEKLHNVTFHKSVDKQNVKSLYAMSNVCLVPLRDIPLFDSFIPSKMFEIMAMQRPVIASLKGEAADIVLQSGGGLVVRPEDVDAIKEAILELFSKQELGRELGKNGRRFVREKYNRKTLAERYIDVLNDTVKPSKHI